MKPSAVAAYSTSESRVNACTHRAVNRFENDALGRKVDSVIQERQINIYVDGVLHQAMTCSPWDIEELVAGNLYMQGVIRKKEEIENIYVDLIDGRVDVSRARQKSSSFDKAKEGNILSFEDLRNHTTIETLGKSEERHKAQGCSLFAYNDSSLRISATTVNERIALLEDRSLLFHRTGGVHSAVLVGNNGVEAWFEDIGRHSALDKLAGWCLLHEVDVSNKTLLFSGRVPHEIIVKVIRMGCPLIISPGAPTSLSIDLAYRYGVTLVGFAKHGTFNVYAHKERITMMS